MYASVIQLETANWTRYKKTQGCILLVVLQDNVRVDGRARDDYRYMEIETDVISSASGSARVRLVCIYCILLKLNKITSSHFGD